MALISPGVQVTVVDESQYTPAEPGTVPLIVVATAQDKTNAAVTGTATYTTEANAGKAFKLTSQKDLLDFYGVPFFEKTASSSPVHGSERNEYGLLAAYSLLGVSNGAFIVRANVDLDQLQPQTTAPGANPTDGQWWVDTQTSAWGIQEWNGAEPSTTGGQKFTTKTPVAVLTDSDSAKVSGGAPAANVNASFGDYAIVFETVGTGLSFSAGKEAATIWYKSAGNGGVAGGGTAVSAGDWVKLGSKEWAASHITAAGTATPTTTIPSGLVINGTTVNTSSATVAALVTTINGLGVTGVTARDVNGKLYLYTNAINDFGGTLGTPGDSSGSNAIDLTGSASPALTSLGLTATEYLGPALQQSPHTQVPEWKLTDTLDDSLLPTPTGPRPTGSVWVKTTEPNFGARLRVKKWSTAQLSWVSYDAPMYASTNAALYYLDRSGGGANLAVDTLFTQTNAEENSGWDTTPVTAAFKLWRRAALDTTKITSAVVKAGSVGSSGAKTFSIAETLKGQIAVDTAKLISFTAANTAADASTIAGQINAAGFTNIVATVTDNNELTITHKLGGDFKVNDISGAFASLFTVYNIDTGAGTVGLYSTASGDTVYDYVASNWQPLSVLDFKAAADAPLNEPVDGQLWYDPSFAEVDMMVHNGKTWVGYRHSSAPYAEAATATLRSGYAPNVSASNPYIAGVTVTGDLWISTADLENYPTVYRYNSSLTAGAASDKWELVDKTDQVTEEGILFADARWGDAGDVTPQETTAIADLLNNNYLDTDAPDPALYPKGMLLWNLRRSGGNVKRYVNNYININEDNARTGTATLLGNTFVSGQSQSAYASDRWVTASANNEDGSGTFGRKAQRSVVVAALKSAVDTSAEIRDEERRNFNLIACPGYPELMSNLVNLNIDRGITAFVIGDTPLRLASDATTLTNWGSNAELVTDNGENGIVTYDEYLGVFYPSGFTTDLSGTGAVVPSSHMMLKTIALSDNVSYPWFAPAGTRRGGITNATAAGYIDTISGEFQTVALNEGQRDTLYDLKLNPITFFNGIGLINYGQKTRARNASALDRVNVARLTVYLRSQLNKLARPYLFEPNDKITRDEIKQACDSLLLELVGLRALYDFAVVCDETNNTPTRIDRNELWVDIAIEPVKAVEFIYIPLRIKNTGEI